jgi:PAS domain S-box-containing protein
MSCPFRKLKARSTGNVARGGPVGPSLGLRIFPECVLVLSLLLTIAAWHISSSAIVEAEKITQTDVVSLMPSLASVVGIVGIGIDLVVYVIIRLMILRKSSMTHKAAAMWKEIQRGDERYRAVVDTAADAIVLADQRGTILSFNRAAEMIFGYDADEVIGRSVNLLMPEEPAEMHDGHIGRYVATKVERVVGIGRDVEGRRKDGLAISLASVARQVERRNRRDRLHRHHA